jgi:hypothetical protein
MKNLMLALVATVAFAGIARADAAPVQEPQSQPQDDAIRTSHDPLWTCNMTFKAKGGGFQIIVGKFELNGPGVIRCVDIQGHRENLNVNVRLGASPVALNVAMGGMKIYGTATGIGLARGPRGLLGKYALADAQASFFLGAGGSVALHGGREAVTVNVGVDLIEGVGFQAGLNKLTITAADE